MAVIPVSNGSSIGGRRSGFGASPTTSIHSAPPGTYQYEAPIYGLRPATTYYYAIYDGDRLLAGGDADNGLGDPVANWLVENAEFIGVQRIVWDRAYWNGERGFGPLGSNSYAHTDHIHVELSLAGANAQTPFFTTGAVNGTCMPRCEGTTLINEDCSTEECAAIGAPCLSSPTPQCGEPPPPEPDAAEMVTNAPLPDAVAIGGLSRFNWTGESMVAVAL